MLAIIGGTGLYNLEDIDIRDSRKIKTPFGAPSADIIEAVYQDKTVFFLPRHGQNHQFLPSEINYRANIYALKVLGVKQIISFSAVGSLREKFAPGDFVIPNQYFDFIKGHRKKSFFGNGIVAHISTAEPSCKLLTQWIVKHSQDFNTKIKIDATYACVDGPRLGTKAESYFLRNIGCDLVGMTNIPEVFLANEAQINYATIGIVTDYDCWKEDPKDYVSVDRVIQRYGKSIQKAKSFLMKLLEQAPANIDEVKRKSLQYALLTPLESIPQDKRALVELLLK